MKQGGILRVLASTVSVAKWRSQAVDSLPSLGPPSFLPTRRMKATRPFRCIEPRQGGPCSDTHRECGLAMNTSGHEDHMESK